MRLRNLTRREDVMNKNSVTTQKRHKGEQILEKNCDLIVGWPLKVTLIKYFEKASKLADENNSYLLRAEKFPVLAYKFIK